MLSAFFLRTFPRFLKQSPKTRKQFWASEVRQENNFGRVRCAPLPILLIYLIPPFPNDGARIGNIHTPPRQFARCSRMGAKLAHATASRDFRLGYFYHSNSCVCSFVMLQKISKNTISVEPIALIVSLGCSTLPRARLFPRRSSEGV